VHGGAVGAAVVGHQPPDPDPVAPVEGDRPAQEGDAGPRLRVAQDLDVGQAGGVIDADVDELPAGAAGALPLPALAGRAVPGAALPDSAPAS
jgi:hypothetical protein